MGHYDSCYETDADALKKLKDEVNDILLDAQIKCKNKKVVAHIRAARLEMLYGDLF